MDAKDKILEQPKFSCPPSQLFPSGGQRLFFNLSASSVTAFDPILESPLKLTDDLKVFGVHGLNRARALRAQSTALEVFGSLMLQGSETTSNDSEKDSETKSDAGTYDGVSEIDSADESEEERRDVDDVLYEESVKEKIEILAGMVGINYCSEPGTVLGEVIRVLKELDQARGAF